MTQVLTRHIGDASVTNDKLNSNVAGNGVSGGDGSALTVNPDSTGGANLGTVVNVSANGVAVKIDDITIGENGSNQLEVKSNSISATQIDETGNYTWSGTHSYTGATVSVATPTQNAHACTKAYADALRNGIRHKDNCLAVATSDQTLSGVPGPIDGVTLSADDRILLTGQTSADENGIWVIAAGAWSRPEDFNTGGSASGSQTWVDQGATYQDTMWECTTNEGSDVIDTNDLVFTQRPVGETNTAGTGLTKSGTEIRIGDGTTGNVGGIARTADDIAVAVDDSTIELSSNVIQIKEGGVGATQLGSTSVTASKLGSDVAGSGIGGGNGAALTLDITELTGEATVANDDTVAIYDTSAGAMREMTRSNFLAGVGTGETFGQEAHVISSGETAAGYFTLSQTPSGATNVAAFVIGGIPQVNKQLSPTATADFDILNSNQFHFNNNGAATLLSEHITTGDEVVVQYAY